MADDMRLLVTASINQGLSIREINNKIKLLEKHPSLRKISLKIDVDQKILKTLTDFNNNLNKINQSMGQQKTASDGVTASHDKETQAINQQNQALEKNSTLRQKIVTSADKKVTRTDTTTGSKFDNTTSSKWTSPDGIIDKPSVTVRNIDHAGKAKADTDAFNKLVKERIAGEQKIFDDFVSKEKEKFDLGNKIADQRIKRQETFDKKRASAQQQEINDAYKVADAENKAIDKANNSRAKLEQGTDNKWQELLYEKEQKEIASAQKVRDARVKLEQGTNDKWQKLLHDREQLERTIDGKRIKDVDNAHYQAFDEKMKREAHLGSTQMQDRVRAYDMATKQDDAFNRKRFINEQKFSRMQQDTINKIESARMKFGHNKGVNQSLDAAMFDARNVKNAGDYDNALRNINTSVGKATIGLKAMKVQTLGIGEAFETAMVKFPIWMAASTAFFGVIRGITSSIDTIVQVDKNMTSLMRVSNGEIDRVEILKESIDLAGRLGNKILDIQSGIESFARQGFRGEGLIAISEAATLFSNISEMSVEDASSGLTAAIKGFQLLPEEAMRVVDAVNEVDNNFAISSQNIMQSMQKSVGAAQTFGVSMERLIGLTVSIGETSRESGNIIGNSLKTIFSRITTMGGSVTALNDIGIAVHEIKDGVKDVRDVSNILDDLAGKWSSLNSEQQQSIGLQIAGRFQLSRFLIMMQNYESSIRATESALGSQGSGLRENEQFLKSLEARVNSLANSWTEWSLAAGDALLTDTFIAVNESLQGVLSVFTMLTKEIGLLPVVIPSAVAAVSLMKGNLTTLGSSVLFSNASIASLTISTNIWARSMGMASWAAKGLSVSVAAMGVALRSALVLSGIGIVLVVLEKIIAKISKVNKEQKELEEQNLKVTKSWTEQKKSIDDLLTTYKKLHDIKDKTKEQDAEYLDVQNQLGAILPNIISFTDKNGQMHIKTGDALAREIELTEELVRLDRERQLLNSQGKFEDFSNEREKVLKEIADIEKKMGYSQWVRNEDGDRILESLWTKDEFLDFEEQKLRLESDLASLSDNVSEHISKTVENMTSLNGISIDNSLSEYVKGITDSIDDIGSADWYEISESLSEYIKISSQSQNIPPYMKWMSGTSDILDELKVKYPEASEAIDKFSNILNKTQEDTSSSGLFTVFNDLGEPIGEITGELDELAKKYKELKAEFDEDGAVTHFTGTLLTLKDAQDAFKESLDKNVTAIKSLSSAYDTLNSGETLSQDTLLDLISTYPDLAKHLATTNDLTFNKGELIKYVMEQERAKAVLETENAIANVETTRSELQQKQDLYYDYYNKMLSAGAPSQALISMGNSLGLTDEEKKSLGEYNAEIDKLQAKLLVLKQPLSTWSAPKSGGSKAPKSPKSSPDLKDALTQQDLTKELINAFNAEYIAREKNIDSLERQIKTAEKAKDQVKVIELTTKKIAEQELVITSLKTAQTNMHDEANKKRDLANKLAKDMGMTFDIESWFDSSGNGTEKYGELLNAIAIKSKKVADNTKLSVEQRNIELEEIENQKKEVEGLFSSLQLLKQGWRGNSNEIITFVDEIENATQSLLDLGSTMISSLIDTLKNSFDSNEIIDLDEFNDSIDSIISSLDMIDGKFLKGVKVIDTTDKNRSDLKTYKDDLIGIVNEVKSFQKFTSSNANDLGSQIQRQVKFADDLKNKLSEVNNTIRDRERLYKAEEAALENNIKSVEASFDAQIKAQQNKLDLLDEEIEKEDRIKALREINDDLDKTKADKRFSYITEAGEEILTYDKGRVDELEKEKNELVLQYQREDVKKAIQNEIDRLEQSKTDVVKIMQDKLERTRQIHQQDLDMLRIYQSNLSIAYTSATNDTKAKLDQLEMVIESGFADGSIKAGEGTAILQGVLDAWMTTSITNWDTHIVSVQSKLAQLANLYAQMAAMQSRAPQMSSISSTSSSSQTASKPKYHTGGTAGEEPLAHNEVPAILKLGEHIFTEEHMAKLKNMILKPINLMNSIIPNIQASIPNIPINNSRQVATSGGGDIHLNNVTIQANNPQEFLKGIEQYIRPHKK